MEKKLRAEGFLPYSSLVLWYDVATVGENGVNSQD
jgi:hypothetical protein